MTILLATYGDRVKGFSTSGQMLLDSPTTMEMVKAWLAVNRPTWIVYERSR